MDKIQGKVSFHDKIIIETYWNKENIFSIMNHKMSYTWNKIKDDRCADICIEIILIEIGKIGKKSMIENVQKKYYTFRH